MNADLVCLNGSSWCECQHFSFIVTFAMTCICQRQFTVSQSLRCWHERAATTEPADVTTEPARRTLFYRAHDHEAALTFSSNLIPLKGLVNIRHRARARPTSPPSWNRGRNWRMLGHKLTGLSRRNERAREHIRRCQQPPSNKPVDTLFNRKPQSKTSHTAVV